MTILLINEVPVILNGLKYILHKRFVNNVFLEATSVSQAENFIGTENIDMIISELVLENKSTMGILKSTLMQFPKTKILIFSKYMQSQKLQEFFRLGGGGYFSATCDDINELPLAVETVRSGVRYFGNHSRNALLMELINAKERLLNNTEEIVMVYLSEGLSIKEIATKMNVSIRTIEIYRKKIQTKLQLPNTTDIVRFAVKNGYV